MAQYDFTFTEKCNTLEKLIINYHSIVLIVVTEYVSMCNTTKVLGMVVEKILMRLTGQVF